MAPPFRHSTGGEQGTMLAAVRVVLSVFVLTSALASAYREYYNGAKLRRDGVLNLYPFPRVGRASHRSWQVPLTDPYLANEVQYEPLEKRQLYAFPRVGRGDLAPLRPPRGDMVGVPQRRNDGPGMWFGPRLGRSFRSEDDDITDHSESSERSDPEQVGAQSDRDQRTAQLTTM